MDTAPTALENALRAALCSSALLEGPPGLSDPASRIVQAMTDRTNDYAARAAESLRR